MKKPGDSNHAKRWAQSWPLLGLTFSVWPRKKKTDEIGHSNSVQFVKFEFCSVMHANTFDKATKTNEVEGCTSLAWNMTLKLNGRYK